MKGYVINRYVTLREGSGSTRALTLGVVGGLEFCDLLIGCVRREWHGSKEHDLIYSVATGYHVA